MHTNTSTTPACSGGQYNQANAGLDDAPETTKPKIDSDPLRPFDYIVLEGAAESYSYEGSEANDIEQGKYVNYKDKQAYLSFDWGQRWTRRWKTNLMLGNINSESTYTKVKQSQTYFGTSYFFGSHFDLKLGYHTLSYQLEITSTGVTQKQGAAVTVLDAFYEDGWFKLGAQYTNSNLNDQKQTQLALTAGVTLATLKLSIAFGNGGGDAYRPCHGRKASLHEELLPFQNSLYAE